MEGGVVKITIPDEIALAVKPIDGRGVTSQDTRGGELDDWPVLYKKIGHLPMRQTDHLKLRADGIALGIHVG